MRFILDNPVIAFGILAVSGFMIFAISKLVSEFNLNKALHLKHKSMRLIKVGSTAFKTKLALITSAALAPAVVVIMVFTAGTNPAPVDQIKTTEFLGNITSQADIMSLFETFNSRTELSHRALTKGWFDLEFAMDDVAAPEADGDNSGVPSEGTAGEDGSGTNNQVDGVDEMDNVVTDFKFIYIMSREDTYVDGQYNSEGTIKIVLAYTQEDNVENLGLERTIYFSEFLDENTEFNPLGLYVDDERLIVVGNVWTKSCVPYRYEYYEKSEDGSTNPDGEDTIIEEGCYYQYESYQTQVFVFDKSDYSITPDSYSFSGYFAGTRKIGDSLYIITNEGIPYYLLDNEEADFNLDDYLPSFTVNGVTVTANYENIAYEDGVEPSSFTAFYGIDLDTKITNMQVVLGEASYNLYVSTKNIYLAGTKYNWNDMMFIEGDDVIFDEESNEDPYELLTFVVRIAINDGDVEYDGTLTVEGRGLDQFAMDEHDGYFRIVTTSQNWFWWGWWGGNTETSINNRLTIFDENLEQVSQVEYIGEENELVQATRFVGDYFYIVTYERTDPFYIYDLSNPANPVENIAYKESGFSDYLQPLSEDYMLGIGFEDADEDGRTDGLKIALYNVSDKTHIPLPSKIVYDYEAEGYMWTPTTYNHKDLLVAVHKGFIALPYSRSYETVSGEWRYETGILVLNVDLENGTLSERARIVHSDGTDYDTYVFKSKYIEDYFYTVSNKFVKVTLISDMTSDQGSVRIGYGWYDLHPELVEVESVVID